MIRVCAWHKKYFSVEKKLGQIEPYDDMSETHGVCDECQPILKETLK